jgi:hypothetical protein
MFRRLLIAAAALLVSTSVFAQSQAMNGLIEGTVKDSSGGVLPGVSVTVTNVSTGESKTYSTDATGNFRAPLLSLGAYKVRIELSGFKTYERAGFNLSAGQSVVVNAVLETGVMTETVTVTGEVAIAQPGKIDLGRTISEGEIKNLPLVSRNPYNFAFLQANVTGYENNEFGVPRINANGTQMHTNYQIDGNTNTEKDRAGLRLLPVSEVVVKEVKVVTSGFAPEFGQTTGMVYNAITPSGSNNVDGSVAFRYRRPSMAEKSPLLAASAPTPDNTLNNLTATLGGPLVKDKTHFYLGYEYVDRAIGSDRVVTVKPEDAARLGLTDAQVSQNGVIPSKQKVNFAFAKIDHAVSSGSKLSVRYFFFKNTSPLNTGGGLATLQRSTDFFDRMDSASAQLISSVGGNRLNELRVQFARRHQFRLASDPSVTGPAINIAGVAQFGAPVDSSASANFDFNQKIYQVIDNFTWTHGKHSMKAGFDAQLIDDDRVNTVQSIYTFPSIDAYLAAKSGAAPRGYTNFVQDVGDTTVSYSSKFLGLFVQDDVWLSSRFKLLFGVRYDLFQIPDSRPYALNPLSQSFKVDKNNFAPRAGFSWSLDEKSRTVVRASTGVMYEPPLIDFYQGSILSNGDPKSFSTTVTPAQAGAPAFPNGISTASPPKQSITGIDPNFSTQWALLTNVQLERALNDDLSVSVGYVNSIGRDMPVLVDTNLTPTGATLPDGRPIYNTAARPNANFNAINVFQSVGEGSYNAGTFTLNKRMSHGWQMQATYTLAKGTDNSPLTGTYVVGSGDDRLSDMSSINRDKGRAPFNQLHTFVLSTLLAPKVSGNGVGPAILNNNQLGIIIQANSGLPFNIRSNQDLNKDGITADRPLNLDRNSADLGKVINVDARYVRFVKINKSARAELFVEAKNLFNRFNPSATNRVVVTDALGNPTVALPTTYALCTTTTVTPCVNGGYDQRSFQLGAKITF